MIGFKTLLNWKYKEGYRYVAFNEYSANIEFIREEELDKWLLNGYLQYMMEESKPKIGSFQEYKEKNMPDKIDVLLKPVCFNFRFAVG